MAKKTQMVICRYKNCKHESKELPKDEAFCNGNAYYHKDCWREKQEIDAKRKAENDRKRKKIEDRKEIIDLYFRNVDNHPMYTVLQRDINYLLDKCNCPSDYLLFAARYAIDRGWWKHEHGIMYIARNDEIKEAYKKHLDKIGADKVRREMKENNTVKNRGISFTHKATIKKDITDLVMNNGTMTN